MLPRLAAVPTLVGARSDVPDILSDAGASSVMQVQVDEFQQQKIRTLAVFREKIIDGRVSSDQSFVSGLQLGPDDIDALQLPQAPPNVRAQTQQIT